MKRSADGASARNEETQYETRLVDLEVRISFQESTIEELSSVVRRQQQEIDALMQKIEILRDRLINPEPGIDPAQTKPPHY
jgi:SlyX protein